MRSASPKKTRRLRWILIFLLFVAMLFAAVWTQRGVWLETPRALQSFISAVDEVSVFESASGRALGYPWLSSRRRVYRLEGVGPEIIPKFDAEFSGPGWSRQTLRYATAEGTREGVRYYRRTSDSVAMQYVAVWVEPVGSVVTVEMKETREAMMLERGLESIRRFLKRTPTD